jgi:LPS export ABC transporter protein LptC
MNKLVDKIFSVKAVLLTGCFFILSCENDMKQVEALGKKKIGVEEAYNVESYLSEDAKVKAKLKAPLMLRTQTDTPLTEFPKTLHVDFYNDSIEVESQLFAKYGRYLQNDNKVYLRDSVIVFNITGDTLRTEELFWDQDAQSFYTDKKVTIHKPHNEVIDGIGMTAKQDLTDITIKNIQPNTRLFVSDSTLPQ